MNDTIPDLFELMSRWDVEAKAIPLYLTRQGAKLSQSDRVGLLERRRTIQRMMVELRDMMATMAVSYQGIVDDAVVVEADNEDECWKRVGDKGTVQFKLCTAWAPTDSAIAHEHH